MEHWKDIKGFEGLYQVSDFGRVKSLNYNHTNESRILKTRKQRNGYLLVNLNKKGKQYFFLVHRLVAETFLENPENLPQVNHKDENKTNNRVENLEWKSPKDNCNHGTRNERSAKTRTNGKLSKQVLQYTKNGEFVKEWVSLSEIKRKLGYNKSAISKVCRGNTRLKSYKGYIWIYKEKGEE